MLFSISRQHSFSSVGGNDFRVGVCRLLLAPTSQWECVLFVMQVSDVAGFDLFYTRNLNAIRMY